MRTRFRAWESPYLVAFTDVYTSQDYVDITAPEIALVVRHAPLISDEVLHVATERKSVYELARRRNPAVEPGRRCEAGGEIPEDISLATTRWLALKDRLSLEGPLGDTDGFGRAATKIACD